MSLNVPEEATVVPELVNVLPLSAGAEAWAAKVEAILDQTSFDREDALARIKLSSFSISNSAKNILALYDI